MSRKLASLSISPKIRRNTCKFSSMFSQETTQYCTEGLKDTSQAVLLLALECLTRDELDD